MWYWSDCGGRQGGGWGFKEPCVDGMSKSAAALPYRPQQYPPSSTQTYLREFTRLHDDIQPSQRCGEGRGGGWVGERAIAARRLGLKGARSGEPPPAPASCSSAPSSRGWKPSWSLDPSSLEWPSAALFSSRLLGFSSLLLCFTPPSPPRARSPPSAAGCGARGAPRLPAGRPRPAVVRWGHFLTRWVCWAVQAVAAGHRGAAQPDLADLVRGIAWSSERWGDVDGADRGAAADPGPRARGLR